MHNVVISTFTGTKKTDMQVFPFPCLKDAQEYYATNKAKYITFFEAKGLTVCSQDEYDLYDCECAERTTTDFENDVPLDLINRTDPAESLFTMVEMIEDDLSVCEIGNGILRYLLVVTDSPPPEGIQLSPIPIDTE